LIRKLGSQPGTAISWVGGGRLENSHPVTV
jgi:hypothetical protein